MIRQILMCAGLASSALFAADTAMENEVRALAANGVWDRALAVLEKAPESKTDPALRELLAMSYLYTSSRADTRANLDKAQTMMKDMVTQGGRARFLVSLGRDGKKDKNLVESTPGELLITSNAVEFQPNPETKLLPTRWDKSSLTECAANPKYGTSSHSFHLTATQGKDKSDFNFRPLHNSTEELTLICSLIGNNAPPAPTSGKKK